MRAAVRRLAILTVSSLVATACGPTVDLKTALKVDVVSTGWFDAGITDGKNKLVPTITFKLTNTSDQTLKLLQVNALFRRVNQPNEEWGSGFMTVVGSEGHTPGATTAALTIKSQLGYTGTESRADMFKNSQFVDAKV